MSKGGRVSIICILLAMLAMFCYWNFASAEGKRFWKTFGSSWSGIDRTITAYDYTGQEIKSWSGRYDIEENENYIVFDDQDGKRVIIRNAIVIAEEN